MAKVSICIPTYNRRRFLAFAIASVLEQTTPDWQLLVCDDGSSDDTVIWMGQYDDPRIQYIRHPTNIGKSNNMRSGFAAATGEYFIKFDDDDRLTPKFLSRTVAVLDQQPQSDFVGTDHWIIDSQNQRDELASDRNSRYWGRSDLPEGLVANLLEAVFVRQIFQVGATLFRRQALLEVDFMRPHLRNCEDNDLFVRLALAGKQGYYLPERLMEYRVHAEQQGIDRAIPYLEDKLRYLESYQFQAPNLEQIRLQRLQETQLLLGLRLVERGEGLGRQLLWQGRAANWAKAAIGLGLATLPLSLRQTVFRGLRRF